MYLSDRFGLQELPDLFSYSFLSFGGHPPSLLLDYVETRVHVESVGHNPGINSGHVLVALGKDVLVFPEESGEVCM